MNAALTLEGVTFAHGKGAPLRFDLTVGQGEWLALIGPSGAGKSTLLDLVAGFLEPRSGRILAQGRDLSALEPGERPVSLVFQENNLFPELSAFGNVALGLTTRRRPSAQDAARVERALADVGLAGFEKRLPAEMSGGERQRVALARAFLRERPLMLLDEPFAALGPALRAEMLGLLARLRAARANPPAILMVTHHPEDALAHADRLAFLDEGRIVLSGPPAALLSAGAGNARLAAYLGTAFGADVAREGTP